MLTSVVGAHWGDVRGSPGPEQVARLAFTFGFGDRVDAVGLDGERRAFALSRAHCILLDRARVVDARCTCSDLFSPSPTR